MRVRNLALLCLLAAAPAQGGTRTTVTTYTYNADGARTAVTTRVDAQPPVTVFLTWDNFTPDAGAPASGTVSAANGNLLGIGAQPGVTDRFAYDQRDRLTRCSADDRAAASHSYNPASLLGSSTAAGETVRFYYDNAASARMINTSHPASGLTTSFLGPVRYLGDGTEQVLLTPRKDVAGVYDAAAQTLAPYQYDPYGRSAGAGDLGLGAGEFEPAPNPQPPAPDLSRNPFQYAGEYRDVTCDAYYLRARWYLPEQETFLSRDALDAVHRYSYTGGNPIGRVDPTGLRFTGVDFSRDVDRAVRKLMPGAWSYVEPILPVWGGVIGGMELLGLLPTFFHHPTIEQGVDFGFLAASVVAEAGAETYGFDERFARPASAFRSRIGIDAVLGVSQTAAQSYRHGRVDVPAVIQGAETTAFGILWDRGAIGIGYRPYNLTSEDVERLSLNHLSQPANDDLLVFRARINRVDASGTTWSLPRTSPLLERLHLGLYHESVIAFSREEILLNHLTVDDEGYAWIDVKPLDNLSDRYQYMYAGRVERDGYDQLARTSPLGIPKWQRPGSVVSTDSQGIDLDRVKYSKFGDNCQVHAEAVRRGLGL